MEEIDKRNSLQPQIPWTKTGPIKEKNMIRHSPDTLRTSMYGKSLKMQYIGLMLVVLRNGTKIYQTRSNAIILHDTLRPVCIERVVSRRNQVIFYTRISKYPRLAPTITLKANWRTDVDPDVGEAACSSSQPIKSNQLARTGLHYERARLINERRERTHVGCERQYKSGMKKGFSHGTRHGKSEEQTYYHKSYNAWKRCRKRTDESGEIILAFLTDSSKMQDTVRLKKNLGGQKRSAKKWMTQLKRIILTRRRKRSLIDTDQNGLYN